MRCLGALFCAAMVLSACADAGPAGTAEQRNLGDLTLRQGLEFSLGFGTIDDHTETGLRARASIPLPQFSLAAGPGGARDISLQLANIHTGAELQVLGVFGLNATEMPGCPQESTLEAVVCAEAEGHPACQPPETIRDPMSPSEIAAEFALQGCTRVGYRLALSPQDAAEINFAVLGRAASLIELRKAMRKVMAQRPDFVVLLGDAAENASLNGLRDLDFMLRQLNAPTVVLPGEGELVDGSRTQFLQTFGPFDLRWEVGDAQFYAFYSAQGELGERGLSRLQRELNRLDPARAAFLFTHRPPIDPLGPRDQGFRSAMQAARTLSVISDAAVDALFVGHINDRATEDLNGVPMHLTSVENVGEYLWVRVRGDEIFIDTHTL